MHIFQPVEETWVDQEKDMKTEQSKSGLCSVVAFGCVPVHKSYAKYFVFQ
jgi:hypothetical protein